MIAEIGADLQTMTYTIETIGKVAGSIAGIVVLWKTVIAPIRKHMLRLVDVQKQFYPNGGGSLRDVINSHSVSIEAIQHDQKITIRKLSSQETIRTIEQEQSSIAILRFDEELKLTEANPAAQRLLGADLESLRWFGWKNYIENDYVDKITRAMEQAAEEKRRVASDVIIKRTKTDGISAAFSFVPVVCEKQHFFGFWALVVPLSPAS